MGNFAKVSIRVDLSRGSACRETEISPDLPYIQSPAHPALLFMSQKQVIQGEGEGH